MPPRPRPPTVAQQRAATRRLVESLVHETVRPHHLAFVALRAALCRQPAWAHRGDALVAFRVVPNPSRRRTHVLQVQLRGAPHVWTTVSWARRTSSRVRHPDPLRAALRSAVEGQTYAWGAAHARTGCAVCGTLERRQVDHHPVPFVALARAFLATEAAPPPPQTFCFDVHSRVCFRAADAAFEQRWQAYHQREARYQWLCERHHQRLPEPCVPPG